MLLVEMPIYPGSGGNPVFVIKRSMTSASEGMVSIVRLFLIGVLSQVTVRTASGVVESRPIPRRYEAQKEESLNIGVAFDRG